jgi:hypothetical protein
MNQPIKVIANQLQNKDHIAGRGIVSSLLDYGRGILVYYRAGIVNGIVDFPKDKALLIYRSMD